MARRAHSRALDQDDEGLRLARPRPSPSECHRPTATALRGRIELVLGYAGALGHRDGENPAAWRNGLDHVLPARAKVAPVRHHAAMPHREAPSPSVYGTHWE